MMENHAIQNLVTFNLRSGIRKNFVLRVARRNSYEFRYSC